MDQQLNMPPPTKPCPVSAVRGWGIDSPMDQQLNMPAPTKPCPVSAVRGWGIDSPMDQQLNMPPPTKPCPVSAVRGWGIDSPMDQQLNMPPPPKPSPPQLPGPFRADIGMKIEKYLGVSTFRFKPKNRIEPNRNYRFGSVFLYIFFIKNRTKIRSVFGFWFGCKNFKPVSTENRN